MNDDGSEPATPVVVSRLLTEARELIKGNQDVIAEAGLEQACANIAEVATVVGRLQERVRSYLFLQEALYADYDHQAALAVIGGSAGAFVDTFAKLMIIDDAEGSGQELRVELLRQSEVALDGRDRLRSAFASVINRSDHLTRQQKTTLIAEGDESSMTIDDVIAVLDNLMKTVDKCDAAVGDTAVNQACLVAALTAKFVRDTRSAEVIGLDLCDALAVNFSFRRSLVELGESALVFQAALTVILVSAYAGGDRGSAAVAVFEDQRDRLRAQERVIRGLLDKARRVFLDVVVAVKPPDDTDRARARRISDQLAVNLGTFNNRDESELAAERAQEAQQKSELAAGRSGAEHQAAAFEEYSRQQQRLGDRFRWATMILLGLLVAAAGLLAGFLPEMSPTEIAVKVSVAVPAGVLIGYVAREAARHQARATRFGDLAVKLRTLPAFIAELDTPDRRRLTRTLGAQVFGRPGPLAEDELPPAGVYGELLAVMKGLTELLRARERPGDGGKG